MKDLRSATLLAGCVLAAVSTIPAAAMPAKKHSKNYVKGTNQMAGGYVRFGQTYTVNDDNTPLNITVTRAEYSVEPYNKHTDGSITADVAHKLLIIHFRVKNPNKNDVYIGTGHYFQVVDANNNTISDLGDVRRESEKVAIGTQIKPGQGIDDLMDEVIVPAQGPITKLILQSGRIGTNEKVLRYDLGTAPNIIQRIPAPYADPADKYGATPLAVIPATMGATYHAGYLDLALDSVSFAPGPLGRFTADGGKQFVVLTVTVTNKSWTQLYFNGNIAPVLATDDDKITDFHQLTAHHDDDYQGRKLDPGEVLTERLILQVPSSDPGLKTLTLHEDMGDDGQSKAFVYDVSNVK